MSPSNLLGLGSSKPSKKEVIENLQKENDAFRSQLKSEQESRARLVREKSELKGALRQSSDRASYLQRRSETLDSLLRYSLGGLEDRIQSQTRHFAGQAGWCRVRSLRNHQGFEQEYQDNSDLGYLIVDDYQNNAQIQHELEQIVRPMVTRVYRKMALETDDSAVEPERMLIGCYAETHGAKTYEKGGHLDIHPDNASAYHSSTFTVPTVQTKQESLLATYSRCGLNEYGTPGSKMREVIERSTRDGSLEVARSIYLRSAFEASGKSRQHLPTREDSDSVYGQNETVRDGIRPLTTRALSCLSHTVNWSKDSVDHIHNRFNTSICYMGTPSETLGGTMLDVSYMGADGIVSVGETFIPKIALREVRISDASSSA